MKSNMACLDLCTVSYLVDTALARLRTAGPIFTAKEARSAGISWRDLYRLRDDGALVELSRGLFQLEDSVRLGHPDFVVVGARAPHGMVCLTSALSYWDLSDDIASRVDLAVPRGTTRPAIDYPPTLVHVFAAETFAVGRSKVTDAAGPAFWITDRERTVIDAFRLRHRLGDETAYAALRRYLHQRPNTSHLLDMAHRFRVTKPVMTAIHVLQA